ncbi:MAG TPA: polysaccharide biosynthesis tyrosine autokinase [Allosphingosinicella sp.]|nr:polysaccharide biosynthesis tyrosine autokinase [Allosphingosinicella sp.]
MNDQAGSFASPGPMVPFGSGGALVGTGLREVVFAGGGPAPKRLTPSEIWRVVLKWWWLIGAIVCGCVIAAFALSLLTEPEYRARTTLEINREGGVQPVQMGELNPLQMQDRDFINTQAGLLRSRALAERVARGLNLGNTPPFASASTDRAARDSLAASFLEGSVAVEPVRDSRLLELTVESTDPGLAARIANSYAENFIRANLERRFEATSYARNFLEQRLGTVKSRLEQSERQLVAYAQAQGIVTLNVDSGNGEGGRSEQPIDANSLIALNQALQEARAERISAEQRYRQAQGNRSTTEVLGNPTVQSLTTQRAELQAQYQEKLGIFQPDYPVMVQLKSRIESLDAALATVTGNVSSSLRSEFAAARAKENELDSQVNALKSSLLNLRARSIQYTILQREVDTNRSLYDALLQRYKEVGVAGGVGTNAVSVVDRAQVPVAPFKPNLPFNVVLGLLAGLVLGFGSAFALEWMDDTIKTPEDLTNKLGIAPLGIIPALPKGTAVENDLGDARSQVSESYQSVRTALQFSTDHGVPKSLFVTSTRAAEGKSSSVLAIAQSISRLGSTVLLIDADLRKPTFRGTSGDSAGLSNLLSGSDDLEKCIHPTDRDSLFLLPAGKIPPNPAELLAGGRFELILQRATQMFDHVIVDGPPVLGLADAPLLASHCEGTIMVIEAGKIRRVAALSAVERIRAGGARIMGGILTKFSATQSGYGYGYGYGYGDDKYSYRLGEEPKRQIELLKRA